jgi:hypothetical protein
VITYCATLDVPRELVEKVARLLAVERRRRGTSRGSRALICFWQAVLGVRCVWTAPSEARWVRASRVVAGHLRLNVAATF